MSTLAVNPVEAEWLEAVYKITSTPKPEGVNGSSSGENAELKKNLEEQFQKLEKRLARVKAPPGLLVAKLQTAGKDIKAGYKLAAIGDRLNEIEEQIGTAEKGGGKGVSQDWIMNESRTVIGTFQEKCQKSEAKLVKLAQQRAQTLADTETDKTVKKRLLAAAQETNVDFIHVPINRVAEGFRQDLSLGGPAKQKAVQSKYDKELQNTEADIQKVIDGERFAAVVRREQKPREKQREAESLKIGTEELQKKIETLRELDSVRAKEYEERLKTANSSKKVANIGQDIDGSISRRQVNPLEISNKQKALGTKAESVTKARKSKKGDERAKLRELENGAIGTKALAGTGNKKVIEAAEKLATDMANASTDPNVSQVYTTLAELKKKLEKKNLKLFFPKEQAALIETLKKVSADVDPLDIEPSQTAVSEASVKTDKLTTDTEEKVKWQGTTKQALGAIRARIMNILDEGLGVTLSAKSKKMAMWQKWKEIQAASIQPDAVIKNVDREVAKLKGQVDTIFNAKNQSPRDKAKYDKLMKADAAAGQKLVDARKLRSEKLAALNKDRKKLVSRLKKEKERVKGDPALEDAVELADQLLKAALQLGKAKNLEEATRKIQLAEKKLDFIEGKDAASSDKPDEYLRTQAPTGWTNAVGVISQKIADIKKEAMAVATGQDKTRVESKIDELTADVFDPGLFKKNFQGPISQLLAATDLNKKKAAREKVLTQVRYLRKQLDSNPVLMQLRVNPFNKKMSTTPVKSFLDEIEFKTTQVVRAK